MEGEESGLNRVSTVAVPLIGLCKRSFQYIMWKRQQEGTMQASFHTYGGTENKHGAAKTGLIARIIKTCKSYDSCFAE